MKMQLALALACGLTASASAQTISTSFSRNDGFQSGVLETATLEQDGFVATFTGGFQEQSFDGPAYNQGPDAFFFVNTGPAGNGQTFVGSFGVRPISSSNDIGTVSFNQPVSEVSFNAADRANGSPSLRVLGLDGGVLASVAITATDNEFPASAFSFSADDLGGLIGSIEFDNAGPAGNPPYAIAIDSFSATAAGIPEPSSLALGSLLLGCAAASRRARK